MFFVICSSDAVLWLLFIGTVIWLTRQIKSVVALRRDSIIATMADEAENERMHLMSLLAVTQPRARCLLCLRVCLRSELTLPAAVAQGEWRDC